MTRTCYVPYFTSTRSGLKTAVCGRLVTMNEHSVTPSCPQCASWLDADDKETKRIVARWAAEDAERNAHVAEPVRSILNGVSK